MADYFTLDEFRLLPTTSDDTEYPDARVEAVAASLTSTIEREVGTSFVPRTFTKTLNWSCSGVALPAPFVLSVTGVSVGGVEQTGPFTIEDGYLTGSWYAGSVSVTYTTGYSATPPADLKEALMWAVRDRLLATSENAGIDARRTSMVTEQGTVNYVLAGEDRPTGYPDLDAAILGWHRRLFGFGFI